MTTKTDELKPCPFCGCANIHITPDEVGSGGQWVGPVHVVCGGDCVAGQSGDDRESAIAAWNRRAALQSQDREDAQKEINQLRQALKDCHTVAIMRGDTFLADCIDNTGTRYQSAFLASLLDHARRIEGETNG